MPSLMTEGLGIVSTARVLNQRSGSAELARTSQLGPTHLSSLQRGRTLGKPTTKKDPATTAVQFYSPLHIAAILHSHPLFAETDLAALTELLGRARL